TFSTRPCAGPTREWIRMTREQLQASSKKTLIDLARKQGIAGWHGMTKDELIAALLKRSRSSAARKPAARKPAPPISPSRQSPPPKRVAAPVQAAAARDTSGTPTAEEVVESSKYDTGVPTKDLSAKVPRDLPAGYGKDRIVVMVRDPYWLHAY